MSQIKSLEIRGIRNFGDETAKAKLRLSRPLTLILGPNGTGKTTIIEALKFITSGEYPPDSDKGKSFVHEPKLTRGHTVRGCVKAKIVDKKGRELTASRTIQVTRQQTGNLQFKALDNTLTHMKDGEKAMITNRCADANLQLLSYMGVSKAILNYVIFCHQEESNWPLEDGKKLKDKFDEIFDTSSFNKAMDVTAKYIKELQAELKTIKAHEGGAKNMVEEVELHEKNLRTAEEKKLDNDARIEQIDNELRPIENREREIMNALENFNKVSKELEKRKTDYKISRDQIDNLKVHIKEIFNGTESELLGQIKNFEEVLSKKCEDKVQLEKGLQSLQEKESRFSKKISAINIQLGTLRQKAAAFDEKVSKRNKMLKQALESWQMTELNDEISEEKVADYVKEIKEKLHDFDLELKEKIRKQEQEERHVQSEVDEHRTEKTSIESEKSVKSKEKAQIKLEINQLRKEIQQTGTDSERLNIIELELSKATKKFEQLSEQFDETSLVENLKSKMEKKRNLEGKVYQLDQEMNSLHHQSSQQAELEMNQQRCKEKEEQVSCIKGKHKNNLELIFEKDKIPEIRIKNELENIQKKLTEVQKGFNKSLDLEQQKVTRLETALKFKEKEIASVKDNLKEKKQKVDSICQGEEYDEILKLQQMTVKKLQDKKGIYSTQSLMYKDYLKNLEESSCCPLCERSFKAAIEADKLKKKLLLDIERNPDAVKQCERDLRKEQTKYDSLQQLKPVVEEIAEIENETLPKLENSKRKTLMELDNTKENLEDLRLSLAEPEEKLKVCKTLYGDVALLDSYLEELDHLNQTISSQKYQMTRLGKIGDRTMQEVQSDKESIQLDLRDVEGSIDTMQTTLEQKREEIRKARELKMKKNEEALKIRTNMQKLKQLKDKVSDLCTKVENIEESIHQLGPKLSEAESALSEAEKELNKLKQNNRNDRETDSEFKMQISTQLRELETIQSEITDYINSKSEDYLNKIQQDLDKTTLDEEANKKEIAELNKKIHTITNDLSSQELGKKDLQNNLDLMAKEKVVKLLKTEIKDLQEQVEMLKSGDLEKEYTHLCGKRGKLEKEKATINGKGEELRETIRNLKFSILTQDKYRSARKNYKKYHLQLIVQEQAIDNLKAYITVLDKSMIKFHSERMATVNKIMSRLWSLVYRGNDTTSIQIRVNETGLGDKRRSYNYKLVQVKREREMDMKGRCSAGQKVLASIIIRMALAETFCNDCAIFALDEPTTNLDEEHATKLAETLAKVIKYRSKHQKNFQMIVISHDEKFVSSLCNVTGRQSYQELYRNNLGFTLIRNKEAYNLSARADQIMSKSDEEDDDDDESQDVTAKTSRSGTAKKRNYEDDDSPPPVRATKRRAR